LESFSILPAIIPSIEITFNSLTLGAIAGILVVVLLLFGSALISGSEVAFFSLSPNDINDLEQKSGRKSKEVLKLLQDHERLLAIILITNNFINVGIVMISTYITNSIFDFSSAPAVGFIFQVVVITFLLLLFGEVLPKVYANQRSVWFSTFMAFPLTTFGKAFRPLVELLVRSTSIINRRMAKRKQSFSFDDLSEALDLTDQEAIGEKKILQGIVEFGSIEVKEIMKPRIDVVAVDTETNFNKLKQVIIDSGYSRIPVYEETIDNIKGILYVKDLLPYIHKSEEFKWQELLRESSFVPESKKINDLLQDFQNEKVHLAIVIDEYGGASGIVTLEDILEEIVGDIADESDEEEQFYTKIKENLYSFEGKTQIVDFTKVFDLENDYFDEHRGDADTLAGLILELSGKIPAKNAKFKFRKFLFTIEAADNRRIKRIIVEVNGDYEESKADE